MCTVPIRGLPSMMSAKIPAFWTPFPPGGAGAAPRLLPPRGARPDGRGRTDGQADLGGLSLPSSNATAPRPAGNGGSPRARVT